MQGNALIVVLAPSAVHAVAGQILSRDVISRGEMNRGILQVRHRRTVKWRPIRVPIVTNQEDVASHANPVNRVRHVSHAAKASSRNARRAPSALTNQQWKAAIHSIRHGNKRPVVTARVAVKVVVADAADVEVAVANAENVLTGVNTSRLPGCRSNRCHQLISLTRFRPLPACRLLPPKQ